MNKSYVAMDCCIYCNEPKQILLDTQLKDSFDSFKVYTSVEPCEACQAEMAKGFTFLEATRDTGPTGHMWVITHEAAARMIDPGFLTQCSDSICYIEPAMAKELGLYEKENT